MAEANFAIELDEKKGRVLVAKRTLDQGELILHEKPLGKTYIFDYLTEFLLDRF